MTEHQGTTAGQRARTASRRARIMVGGTVVLAAAALLTGCGDKDTGAAAPQSVEGPATPVAGDATGTASPNDSAASAGSSDSGGKSPSSSPAPRDDGSAASAPASGTSRCHTSELRAKVGPNDPGAGQENFALVVTNRSGHTCTVRGYPGLAFVNGKGQQVSVDPDRTGGTKTTVRLTPGKSAWAALSFSNPAMTGVTTVTPAGVEITPPDETASLHLAWPGGPVTNTGKASVPRVGTFSAGTGA